MPILKITSLAPLGMGKDIRYSLNGFKKKKSVRIKKEKKLCMIIWCLFCKLPAGFTWNSASERLTNTGPCKIEA